MATFEPLDPRQYVCFVCGTTFIEYSDYRAHIITTHEEGREYVLCPLDRCRAPVRDVRLHFRVKHPHDKCPTEGQMKALVWSDQRNPRKKSRPKFKEGTILSIKNGGKKMHYRSGYEKDVYECLEVMDEVQGYKVENFRVEYQFNGRSRGYYPDLLIQFTDGHFEVWEIKPQNQEGLPINIAKWSACREYCLARGWAFATLNEHAIAAMRKRLKDKLIVEYRKQKKQED